MYVHHSEWLLYYIICVNGKDVIIILLLILKEWFIEKELYIITRRYRIMVFNLLSFVMNIGISRLSFAPWHYKYFSAVLLLEYPSKMHNILWGCFLPFLVPRQTRNGWKIYAVFHWCNWYIAVQMSLFGNSRIQICPGYQ